MRNYKQFQKIVLACGALMLFGSLSARSEDEPVWEAIFSGRASDSECERFPKTPIGVSDPNFRTDQYLLVDCVKKLTRGPEQRQINLRFEFLKDIKPGTYEFHWTFDPLQPPDTLQGMFTRDPGLCMQLLELVRSKVAQRTPLVSSVQRTPLEAKWDADCAMDDDWGTVMAFKLQITQQNQKNVPKNSR